MLYKRKYINELRNPQPVFDALFLPAIPIFSESFFDDLRANNRGTLPYFLRDNATFTGLKVNQMPHINRRRSKELRVWAKENLLDKVVQYLEFAQGIRFTSTGIKEFLNQPHRDFHQKNELLKEIDSILSKSKIVGDAPDIKGNTNNHYYYLETKIREHPSYIVIRHTKKDNKYTLYSIVDKIRNR